MNYLVLGSEGQIGKPLVEYLKSMGHTVSEIDLLNDREQDLRNIIPSQYVIKAIQKADIIFFLAFDVGGSRYLKKYEQTPEFVDNNLRLMTNTFDLLRLYKKKFIFASSQMSNMTWSTYGNLKAIGEKYTKMLGGIVVHFWNVYGPEHDKDKFHVISDFITQAKRDGSIHMLTDGTESRQMLHVDDACVALESIADIYEVLNKDRIFCITSFEWTTIKRIADIIGRQLNRCVFPGEAKDTVQKDSKNDPDDSILTFWRPQISIEEGIALVIRDMK